MHPVRYSVQAWSEIFGRDRLLPDLDRILFASASREIDDPAERPKFQKLWLGQYLADAPDLAMIAVADDGRAIGYCVGWADEPWRDSRFDDLDYLVRARDLLVRYPAHLHINIDPDWRGQGVGRQLVEALAARLSGSGVPGLHVTTGHDARNVGFYLQNGFSPAVCITWRERRLLMLTRRLFDPAVAM